MNLKCKQAQELTLDGNWGVECGCCYCPKSFAFQFLTPKSFAFYVKVCVVLSDFLFWSDLNLLLWWWLSMATAVATHLASNQMAPKAQGSAQSLSTPHSASPAKDVEKHWAVGVVALLC